MDFFQAQEFFKKMFPNSLVEFEFDKNCIRQVELIYTDGQPNPVHHVENHKVKVTVHGMEPVYVDIAPHRQNFTKEAIESHAQIKIA